MGSGIGFSWTEADLYGPVASVGLMRTCMGQWY